MSINTVRSSQSVPTGSVITSQPPGSNATTTQGAGLKKSSSYILTSTSFSKSNKICESPTWISTSSRPVASGSISGMSRTKVPSSASQPPPLPPPPLTPQLVPLKARLARSKSISSRSTNSRPECIQRLRKVSDGQAPTKRLSFSGTTGFYPTSQFDFVNENLKDFTSHVEVNEEIKLKELPKSITHPTERNTFYVCLTSLVFLTCSVVVTSLFAVTVLPMFLIACVVRQSSLWFANVFQCSVCCQCGKFVVHCNSRSIFGLLMSRIPFGPPTEQRCRCFVDGQLDNGAVDQLKALTPAELRWLPCLQFEYNNAQVNPQGSISLVNTVSSPVIVICLRFGAPGLKLARLRELIGTRLITRNADQLSQSSSPGVDDKEMVFGDNTRKQSPTSSLPPPWDTRSRLTQCLTQLSTGYAWKECAAFCLEDHVVRVPSPWTTKSTDGSRLSANDKHLASFEMSNMERLINELSALPFRYDRPLWKAHLVEHYYDDKSSEPSDVESEADSDEFYANRKSNRFESTKSGRSYVQTRQNSGSLICRRSQGSGGLGSLLVFRLHPVLSDDGKALVHLLTSCLGDVAGHNPMGRWGIGSTRSTNNCNSHVLAKSHGYDSADKVRRWRGRRNPSGQSEYENETKATELTTTNEMGDSTKKQSETQLNKLSDKHPPVGANYHAYSKSLVGDEVTNVVEAVGEDDDPEELEAAQWWYTFWASSLATMVSVCDLFRILLTGPVTIMHKYFCTRADMGLMTNVGQIRRSTRPTAKNESKLDRKMIHKSTLLSFAKLNRLRQITKASYSEIILSLLAGALRAYHQVMGFKHPPDLLAFLSTKVPVLPGCYSNQSKLNRKLSANQNTDKSCPALVRLQDLAHRLRLRHLPRNYQQSVGQHQHTPCNNNLENGLMPTPNRTVSVGSPPLAINDLCPGRHVLADFCLPTNTEGMLPRLWETKQRLTQLNTSVDPLCLDWFRSVLYTLMPHPTAKCIESHYGPLSKASVTLTGVEVVSPFGTSKTTTPTFMKSFDCHNQHSYLMPKTRRLAYMSLLASKSAEVRGLKLKLRKRGGRLVYPPRLGTSFRALAKHLVNANAGIIYIAGSPIIRIDTWMPSPKEQVAAQLESNTKGWHMCRDLSATFTTYAGQLSVAFSASSIDDNAPKLDLILESMRSQVRCCNW